MHKEQSCLFLFWFSSLSFGNQEKKPLENEFVLFFLSLSLSLCMSEPNHKRNIEQYRQEIYSLHVCVYIDSVSVIVLCCTLIIVH